MQIHLRIQTASVEWLPLVACADSDMDRDADADTNTSADTELDTDSYVVRNFRENLVSLRSRG